MKEYPSKYRAPERRFDRGNRQFENPQYIGQDRQNTNPRKKFTNRRNDPVEMLTELLKKAAPELKARLNEISDSQKRLANAEERKAVALEKIAICFQGGTPVDSAPIDSSSTPASELAPASKTLPSSETTPVSAPETALESEPEAALESEPASESEPLSEKKALTPVQVADETIPPLEAAPVSPVKTKATEAQRARVLQILKKMYKEKATYNQIALRLEAENLPTFSGRGKWHAQTIHRLLKK